MSTFGGTYSTGLISVANNALTVTGAGVLWADILEGDWLTAGGSVGVIDAVTGAGLDGITLKAPWKGSTQSGASYVIVKASWLRYEPALTQAKLRELLARFDDTNISFTVTGSAPDPEAVAKDGDIAVKISGGVWQYWKYLSGVWVFQGSPVGAAPAGIWSSATSYLTGQSVTRLGNSYIANRPSLNADPPSSPDDWSPLYPSGQYDIAINAAGKPAAGEVLLRMIITRPLGFSTNMAESLARVLTAPTADAAFPIKRTRSGVTTTFATLTIAAGNTAGTFAGNTQLVPDDLLSVVAPPAQDATMADIAITLTGYR